MKKISVVLFVIGFLLIITGGVLHFIAPEDSESINNNSPVLEDNSTAWNGLYKSEENGWSVMLYSEDNTTIMLYALHSDSGMDFQRDGIQIEKTTKISYSNIVLNDTEIINIIRSGNQITIEGKSTDSDAIINELTGTYKKYGIPKSADYSELNKQD